LKPVNIVALNMSLVVNLTLNCLPSLGTAVVETGVTGTTLPPSVTATGISTAASLTPSGLFLTFAAS